MEQEDVDRLLINEAEAGERIDKILAARYSQVKSRTYFQHLIDEGHVLINGCPVKKRALVAVGDEVEVEFVLSPELNLTPEPIPLAIVYEDNDLLVVNKPAGMVVHPAVGNWSGTFVNALLHHCQNLMVEKSDLRPGIVHRLDKDTTGLLIAAKTPLAHQRLIRIFAERKIYKIYVAFCLGNPGSATIEAPIGRDLRNRKLMAVSEDKGKPAVSHCQVIDFNEKVSVVRIILATGRTHQIRVHMKHHGTPVLGDSSYGSSSANKKYNVNRQMLHAYGLQFEHPISGKKIVLTAPLPDDMQLLADKMGLKTVVPDYSACAH